MVYACLWHWQGGDALGPRKVCSGKLVNISGRNNPSNSLKHIVISLQNNSSQSKMKIQLATKQIPSRTINNSPPPLPYDEAIPSHITIIYSLLSLSLFLTHLLNQSHWSMTFKFRSRSSDRKNTYAPRITVTVYRRFTIIFRRGRPPSQPPSAVVCGAMVSQEDEKVSLGQASQDVVSRDQTANESVTRADSSAGGHTWFDKVTFFLTKWGVETNGYNLLISLTINVD